jgi:hypothetical protein
MNYIYHIITCTGIVLFAGSFVSPCWAQDDKPAAEKPAKKPAVQKPANAAEAAPPANDDDLKPENPAVAAILATKPTTPAECIRAAETLIDLGHEDVAKSLLKKVVDAKLDSQQLAELGAQFGAAVFIDMAGRKALLPEAKQLSDAIVPAVAAKLGDPKRIAALIGQLQDASPEKRMQALAGLQEAQQAAVEPLMKVLADAGRAVEHANVRTVLATMGRPAREALTAALNQSDPKLVVQIIQTLAEMNDAKAAVELLGPCLAKDSPAEVRAAAEAALKHLIGRVPTRSEAVGMLLQAAKLSFHKQQPTEDDKAARQSAMRYAGLAHSLAPENREIQLLYLTALLDAAAYQNGLDRPLDDKNPAVAIVKPCGIKTIDAVLDFALAERHPAAATAAARLLGEMAKADEVLYQGDKPAPLVRALQNPDRRLRMAALEAIVRLRPTKPFAGSSYVPAALRYFAASSGVRRALVAGPSLEHSRSFAGLLASVGLQTDTAVTGKELVRLAAHSPDYELAWIDVSINHPQIAPLLQELRRDERTASLRIGLMARSGFSELAERLAAGDPMSKAFARPHDDPSIRWQLEQLIELAPDEFVGFDIRQQQAARALDMLADLNRTSGKLYDLRLVQDSVLAALVNPKLAQKAVTVLANMNSAESQRALVDVANRFTNSVELRTAAVSAFRENRQKFGILLTTEEIRRQYRLYNESETQDAATQRILGLILDCLEVGARGQGPEVRE